MEKKEFQFKAKKYSHLDYRKNVKSIEKNIKNPKWVARHGFLPLIHITMWRKIRKGTRKKPEYKSRDIFYSSHTDSYIYQYYANKLSTDYENYIKENNFYDAPTAYRALNGKCNIDFAKEAFDFIKNQKDSIVFVTDFHHFFDSLDHKILKKNICKVMKCNSGLPDDDYAVYKSLIHACYFDLDDIAEKKGVSRKSLQRGKHIPKILLSSKEMRELKKTNLQFYQDKIGHGKGIPQGTSISAVYANVYMINFDQRMSEYVKSVNGFYRRYSDDIICVVPAVEGEKLNSKFNFYQSEIKIEVSEDKTKTFKIRDGKIIENLTKGDNKLLIEYLGFSYDGERILIKDASLNKFYRKLDNRLYLIKELSEEKGRVIGRKNLYRRFSHLSLSNKRQIEEKNNINIKSFKNANFLYYVDKAENIMKEPQIKHQVHKHWNHIHKFLSRIR